MYYRSHLLCIYIWYQVLSSEHFGLDVFLVVVVVLVLYFSSLCALSKNKLHHYILSYEVGKVWKVFFRGSVVTEMYPVWDVPKCVSDAVHFLSFANRILDYNNLVCMYTIVLKVSKMLWP